MTVTSSPNIPGEVPSPPIPVNVVSESQSWAGWRRRILQPWDYPVDVGRVRLRNPVIAASGTYGYGLEYSSYGDPSLLGAVVVKSLTVEPRPGFRSPRVTLLAEPGSMLNAIGVPNPGVERWAETILPSMTARGVAVVARARRRRGPASWPRRGKRSAARRLQGCAGAGGTG